MLFILTPALVVLNGHLSSCLSYMLDGNHTVGLSGRSWCFDPEIIHRPAISLAGVILLHKSSEVCKDS